MDGGEAKTLLPSLKETRLVWSADGQRFAYAKEGKLYVGTLEGGEPKQLAGEDAPKPGENPPTARRGPPPRTGARRRASPRCA